MSSDAEIAEMLRQLRQKAGDAMEIGSRCVAWSFDPFALLALLDAIEEKAPRNVPAILRDNAIDRMEAAADRIEQAALALGIMAVNK